MASLLAEPVDHERRQESADGPPDDAAQAELRAQARAVQDEVLAPLDAGERQVLQELLLRVHHGTGQWRGGL